MHGQKIQFEEEKQVSLPQEVPKVQKDVQEIKEDIEEEDKWSEAPSWEFDQYTDKDGTEVFECRIVSASDISTDNDSEPGSRDNSSDRFDYSKHARNRNSTFTSKRNGRKRYNRSTVLLSDDRSEIYDSN